MGNKIFTGIGSRETPDDVLHQMEMLGSALARMGWTLRSGGAPGADVAFERGCSRAAGAKEIYLPWKNFSKNPSPLFGVTDAALEVAEWVWEGSRESEFCYLKRPVKLLMGRNVYQIVGQTLDTPSDVVICWTRDGCTSASKRTTKTGGTGQAIAHASDIGVPVFNLKNENAFEELIEFLGAIDDQASEISKR